MKNIFYMTVITVLLTGCTLSKQSNTTVKTDITPLPIEETKPTTSETTTTTPEPKTDTTTKPQIDKKETTIPKTDTKDTATTDEMTKELDALIDEIVSGK